MIKERIIENLERINDFSCLCKSSERQFILLASVVVPDGFESTQAPDLPLTSSAAVYPSSVTAGSATVDMAVNAVIVAPLALPVTSTGDNHTAELGRATTTVNTAADSGIMTTTGIPYVDNDTTGLSGASLAEIFCSSRCNHRYTKIYFNGEH